MHPLLTHLPSFPASASVGVAAYSYEYSYPYEDYNGDNQISEYDEDIDFSYQDFSIGFPNENGSAIGHLKWEAAKTAITLRHLIKAALNVKNIPSPMPKLFLRSHLGFGEYYESYADLYHMRETDILVITHSILTRKSRLAVYSWEHQPMTRSAVFELVL